MSELSESNRRQFIERTAKTAVLGATTAWAGSARGSDGSGPLVAAVIGPGGMGTAHIKQLAANKNVQIAYVCDVDASRLAEAAKTAESLTGRAPQAVRDMRTVFDDKSVEAVWIATPDHWHGPATILACEAGKHVYVEKPCSHNIREGRLMIDAARRYQRVVQVGTQSRSTPHVLQAIERLREGAIGEILVAKVWNSQQRRNIGHAAPTDPPAYLDYDLWIGPAPIVPYRSTMLPGIWRWWYDFGAGDMGNDGVHDLDLAWWGLGVDSHPSRIAALGGKYFFDDDQQFPDTQSVVFEYPGGSSGRTKQLLFEQRIWSPYDQEGYSNGIAFYGTKGWLALGHVSGYRLYAARNKLVEELSGCSPDLAAHHQNFIDCIRTGDTPAADIEIGHRSAALCHLGNIATRIGRALSFDPQNERIVGDAEADRMIRREYREGHWAVPSGV